MGTAFRVKLCSQDIGFSVFSQGCDVFLLIKDGTDSTRLGDLQSMGRRELRIALEGIKKRSAGSFDCVAHKSAVSNFAQDDMGWG
jgi:hypothetical protein